MRKLVLVVFTSVYFDKGKKDRSDKGDKGNTSTGEAQLSTLFISRQANKTFFTLISNKIGT